MNAVGALGVLGDPVSHSKSPAMHRAALAQLGLAYDYCAYRVRPADLGRALECAQALGFVGLNLTIPHKVAALEHMDELDPGAARIGAVNTVHWSQGRCIGYNTDAPGLMRGIQELGLATPARVMLLGSGGAARAILEGLTQAWPQVEIDWVSRRAHALRVPGHVQGRCHPRSYDQLVDPSWAQACTLWINATSVGLHGGPDAFPAPLPLESLTPDHAVVDIVYPTPTGGLLERAIKRGAAVQDGRTMLLWQGVLALEIWLAQKIPLSAVNAMRATLGLDDLRGDL